MSIYLAGPVLEGAVAAVGPSVHLAGGTLYEVSGESATLRFGPPAGGLRADRFIVARILLEGFHLAVFGLRVDDPGMESAGVERSDNAGARLAGPARASALMAFTLLPGCEAQMAVPLSFCNQSRWSYGRSGAWLKVLGYGDVVDPARADSIRLTLDHKADGVLRFHLGPLEVVDIAPTLLADPVVVDGPLVDELGQRRAGSWEGKTASVDDLRRNLSSQREASRAARWPEWLDPAWGGRPGAALAEGSGYFRVHHDGRRYWLLTPEGRAFWSMGLDCVRADSVGVYPGLEKALAWLPSQTDPQFAACFSTHPTGGRQFNFGLANLTRVFGADEARAAFGDLATGLLRAHGFNTIGNWSDPDLCRSSGLPFVYPMPQPVWRVPMLFRDMPDVFDAGFEADLASHAQTLAPLAGAKNMIGYFLANEPKWGFASQSVAEGMLYNTDGGPSRRALGDWLAQRHGTDQRLSAAWGIGLGLDELRQGRWPAGRTLTPAARADLEAFSQVLCTRLFEGLSRACRSVAPNHLNLGIRYHTTPPPWALSAMTCFDVFSFNCYAIEPDVRQIDHLHAASGKPVMIGEFHFGALDAGLSGPGICRVASQAARGEAYQRYVEVAAAHPACVGAHYFLLYDQAYIGRFDGENWNVGMLDVCSRPYTPLAKAALRTHERVYAIASGEQSPVATGPRPLPRLFC